MVNTPLGVRIIIWLKVKVKGITAEAERRGSALNLVQHYIVTSHAAGLNIA